VPEFTLSPHSDIERLSGQGQRGAPQSPAGVLLSLRPDVALAAVTVRKGMLDRLAMHVREAFALDVPATPRCEQSDALALAWAGPGSWLAMADNVAGHTLERRLRDEFAGLASICDRSDALVLMRIEGQRARHMLAKGIAVDLHPRTFGPGDVAMTAIGRIEALLWQIDSAPAYDVAVARSMAADLWQWFVEAGAEYGVMIEGRDR
jgi:methylglutamate dehydrogenase subunit D